jgi:hypothetical protein
MLLIEWPCCEMRLAAAALPPSASPLVAALFGRGPMSGLSCRTTICNFGLWFVGSIL